MLAEGTVLGPCRILAPLGAGGMGAAYRDLSLSHHAESCTRGQHFKQCSDLQRS